MNLNKTQVSVGFTMYKGDGVLQKVCHVHVESLDIKEWIHELKVFDVTILYIQNYILSKMLIDVKIDISV